MRLELHQLDRRYEDLRADNPQRQRRLLASLAESGQQTPILVVEVSGQADRYRVIDGYKRVDALERLGRDTIEAVVLDLEESEALVLDRAMRLGEKETAIEQGWWLSELEQRFGYRLQDLARRLDRSVSWVSRRLALVELLPEAVQQKVRTGQITAHVAMKILVPVARANRDDCVRMAEALASHRFSSRQAGELYAAWRSASPSIRLRILDSPDLFLKAHEQVMPAPTSAAEELLRDLNLVLAIASRARRRLAGAAPLTGSTDWEMAQRKIDAALKDLAGLSERFEKEYRHADSEPTRHDSGTAPSGGGQTRDRTDAGSVEADRPQGLEVEFHHLAGAGTGREGGAVPDTDPGARCGLQRQSRPGP